MAEEKGRKAMNGKSKAELRVVLEKEGPKIELHGTRAEILAAWGWLTFSICSRFGIPADGLAAKILTLLDFLGANIQGETIVDMSALSGAEEEDAP